jgi:rod shape determining protein RodA
MRYEFAPLQAKPRFDWLLLLLILILPCLGLTTLYSAGYDENYKVVLSSWPRIELHSGPFVRQSAYFIGSTLLALLVTLVPLKVIKKVGTFLYFAGVGLLILVSLFGIIVNGSRRWLPVGPVNLQPAELVKIGVIVTMAAFLSKLKFRTGGYTFLDLVVPCLILLLPVGLIIKQPDLGTAISVGAAGGIMLFFMGIRLRVLLLLLLSVSLAIIPFWYRLHDYQRNRVISLFFPDVDPQGTGYHIIQSKIAVGSGELFGKGFLRGTQSQLEFLPEHTTDFIFSVVAEEWGFFGCIIVIGAYFFLLLRLLRVVLIAQDLFGALLVVGVTSSIFFHVVVNIGMVVGLLPVVGIPLSLFSYGGSSFLATMVLLAMALRVSWEG